MGANPTSRIVTESEETATGIDPGQWPQWVDESPEETATGVRPGEWSAWMEAAGEETATGMDPVEWPSSLDESGEESGDHQGDERPPAPEEKTDLKEVKRFFRPLNEVKAGSSASAGKARSLGVLAKATKFSKRKLAASAKDKSDGNTSSPSGIEPKRPSRLTRNSISPNAIKEGEAKGKLDLPGAKGSLFFPREEPRDSPVTGTEEIDLEVVEAVEVTTSDEAALMLEKRAKIAEKESTADLIRHARGLEGVDPRLVRAAHSLEAARRASHSKEAAEMIRKRADHLDGIESPIFACGRGYGGHENHRSAGRSIRG